jgi:hypothetical protein
LAFGSWLLALARSYPKKRADGLTLRSGGSGDNLLAATVDPIIYGGRLGRIWICTFKSNLQNKMAISENGKSISIYAILIIVVIFG